MTETSKACRKCREVLPVSKFPPDRRARDGKQTRCRVCIKEFVKGHYRAHPIEHMLARARSRSAKKGIEFAISAVDLVPLPTHCPVFGFALTNGNGQQCPTAYSLDRIDSSRGYVRGNVCVVSYLANRLKNDGTIEQHRRIADWMEEMQRQSTREAAS